jgi:uroporphyrinogen decarboxylase
MNNKERAITALGRAVPDMVPIFELHIDPRVIRGICPECSYEDFVQMFDFDIVMTGTPSDNYRMELIDEESKTYRDEWGVVRRFSKQTVSFPMEGPIKSEKDLDNYTPPDPRDPYRFRGLIRLLERFKGQKLIGMHVHDSFSYPTYLRGMDNLLLDVIERPGLVRKLVRIGVDHTKALMKKARNLGVELFVFGDDYAGNTGPLMSPTHFKEFFLPGLKEVVDTAKELKAYTIKHTDGNIGLILEMIISTGIDALHPIDPEAGMNISSIKERYGSEICVVGNIDTGKILSESNQEFVEKEVQKTIREVAPGGGFIISSANSIHAQVKPENYATMLRAARKYGNYAKLGSEK